MFLIWTEYAEPNLFFFYKLIHNTPRNLEFKSPSDYVKRCLTVAADSSILIGE